MMDSLPATSTIESAIFVKPSVLLGYDARDKFNPSFGVNFNGTSILKFMPVNIFKSCFYLNDVRQTLAVTYYMTDIEKFPSLGYMNESIPLRIEVQTKSGTYFYNIFRFLPNLTLERLQRATSLPSGTFCLNQTNTKPIPDKIAASISINGEVFQPHEKKFVIDSFDTIYDRLLKFARFKTFMSNGEQSIEVHDFTNGLVYHYLPRTRQCKVWAIDANTSDAALVPGQSQYFQMIKPIHLFLLDDMNFQYIGSKECHSQMLCHVWIGENSLSNQSGFERREWYWAYKFNNETIDPWIPVLLVYTRFDLQHKLIQTTEISMFILCF